MSKTVIVIPSETPLHDSIKSINGYMPVYYGDGWINADACLQAGGVASEYAYSKYHELAVLWWMYQNVEADYYGFFNPHQILVCNNDKRQLKSSPKDSNVIPYPYFFDDAIAMHGLGTEDRAEMGIWLPKRYNVFHTVMPVSSILKSFPYDINDSIFDPYRRTELKIRSASEYYDKNPLQYNFEDISVLRGIITNDYPQYKNAFNEYMEDKYISHRVSFFMPKAEFSAYCSWLFDVLNKLDNRISAANYGLYREYCLSAYAALLTDVYFSVCAPSKNTHRTEFLDFRDLTNPEPLYPAFENNNIAMVVVSSNYYIPYFSVLLESLIENATAENNYDIIVLQSEKIEKQHAETISSMIEDRKNFSVRYVDFSRYMHRFSQFATIASIKNTGSEATFYRMAIPYVLRNYNKTIVTDADMVFLKDIAELFHEDIGNNLVAGVIDNCTIGRANGATKGREEYYDELGVRDVYHYVNTGVMIWNLREFRHTYAEKTTYKYITSRPFLVGEQDVLNVMAKGRFFYLDARWDTFAVGGDYNRVYSFAPKHLTTTLLSARANPYVVHYVGRETAKPKPWSNPEIDMAGVFWKYARKSPYYEQIIYRMLQSITTASNTTRTDAIVKSNTQGAKPNGKSKANASLWLRFKAAVKKILLKLKKRYPYFSGVVDQVFLLKKSFTYQRCRKAAIVQDKTVLFSSFAGKNYSCNPKAIYEEMLTLPEYKDYKFIWAFKEPKKFQYLKQNPNTELVKYGSNLYEQRCCEAKYWINNYTMPLHIWPKKEQVYIHTWHGKPIKKVGPDVNSDLTEWGPKRSLQTRYKNDGKKMSMLLSSSDFYSSCMASAFRLSNARKAKILVPGGYARNKSLFTYTEEDVRAIKDKLGIDYDKHVVLYAPTWRPHDYKKNVGFKYDESIDFLALKEKLGEDYIVLFRLHHMTYETNPPAGVLDVSDWEDVNQLYIISDLMISDYSGTIYDYANLKRPMVFYMYDKQEYAKNPGLYLDLDELPGTIVYRETELAEAIASSLDKFEYDEKYQAFNQKHNPLENGNVAKEIVQKYIR